MDQNQTVDNDLQKAIDDITNTTNIDPVFSDPVAAPSSIPEGDTGELGEPIGPFPEPKVEMLPPAPEPIAPLESITVPDLNSPEQEPTSAPGSAPTSAPASAPIPESGPTLPPAPAPGPEPTLPPTPEPTPPPAPEPVPTLPPTPEPAPEPTPESTQESTLEPKSESNPTPEFQTELESDSKSMPASESKPEFDATTTRRVKEAALRDLVPLLDHIDMDAPQKFKIYRDIFDDLKDYTVLDPAYKTATEISDDNERAEALLHLIESIDKI